MSVFKNVKSECPSVGKHWHERVPAACPGSFIPCKLSLEANPTPRGSDSFKRCGWEEEGNAGLEYPVTYASKLGLGLGFEVQRLCEHILWKAPRTGKCSQAVE